MNLVIYFPVTENLINVSFVMVYGRRVMLVLLSIIHVVNVVSNCLQEIIIVDIPLSYLIIIFTILLLLKE